MREKGKKGGWLMKRGKRGRSIGDASRLSEREILRRGKGRDREKRGR